MRPAIVVDVANVMGSVPDGWWKDRAGAATRLVTKVSRLTERGVDAEALGLSATRWFPSVTAVLEGQARSAQPLAPAIEVRHAPAEGDDEIVAVVREVAGAFRPVVVVTSDRELAARVEKLGSVVRGAHWLLDQLT